MPRGRLTVGPTVRVVAPGVLVAVARVGWSCCVRVAERLGPGPSARRARSFVHVYADGVLTVQSFVGEGADPQLLALGSAAPFSAHDRLVVMHAATLLALLARTPSRIALVEEHLRSSVARSLLVDGGTCESPLARALGFEPDAPVVVAHVSGPDRALVRAAAEQLAHDVGGPTLQADVGDGFAFTVLAESGLTPRTCELALGRDGAGLAIGLSAPTPVQAVQAALRQARSASRIARLQGRLAVVYADLAPLDALVWSQPRESTVALVQSVLGRLLAHDARAGTALTDTVEAYLANNGHAEATASSLRIHRHTLKQRLERAESVLGRDLASAVVRADVWLALRARSLLQSADAPSTVPVTEAP